MNAEIRNSINSLQVYSKLKRYPEIKNNYLQAWDSADELLLEHLSQLDLKDKKILISNDSFGALSCALAHFNITTYSDSYVSFKGIENNSPSEPQTQIKSINSLTELSGIYDIIVIRIPKNMSFFEDLLCHISEHVHSNSKIICGYMIKHQAKASFDFLNKIIGMTTTSLAKKKARLVFANFERTSIQSTYPIKVEMDGFKIPFLNHSNLFSREKLDIGTRFLLSHIPQGDFKTILDLGCGNGIIGVKAKLLNQQAQILFCDDSKMAIESAQSNYIHYFKNTFDSQPFNESNFLWTNCYENQKPNSVDLILCNPPFHQGTTIGHSVAVQMFQDSYRTLSEGGILRVIGNTHLEYQNILKRIFGNSQVVATNNKFTIIDSKKWSG